MTLIVRTRELEVYVIHNLQTTGGPLRTHFLISKKMSCYEICLCYVILPKLEFRTSILQFLIRMIKIYKIILPKLALIYDLNLNELKLSTYQCLVGSYFWTLLLFWNSFSIVCAVYAVDVCEICAVWIFRNK